MKHQNSIKNPIRFKTIPKVCSWYKKMYELNLWEVDGDKRTGVSHGMCPECHKKHVAQYKADVEASGEKKGASED